VPQGRLVLRMAHLDELRPLIGQPVTGSVSGSFALDNGNAHLELDARDAGLPGTAQVARAQLTANVTDPTTNPTVDAQLTVDGARAGAISGNARVNMRGPQNALGLSVSAGLKNIGGADLQANSAAVLDLVAKSIQLTSLQTNYKGETLRLLSPARIGFGDGVAVDRLRLGLRQAVLDVAGRVTPTLDLTVALRNVTADLARIAAPDLQADGNLQADARLTGATTHPVGTLRVAATGLHMRTGPGRSLPPASITANANLQGTSAQLDTRLVAGSSHLGLTGRVPLDATGALDLRTSGAVDLTLMDPILTAQGRRLRGLVTLDGTVTGTANAPRATGTVQLANGDIEDFTQGLHLHDMQATVSSDGETVRITRFTARAGQGTLGASGSVGLTAPMPVDISLTAQNARPLASDLLTAVLDTNLTLRGDVQGQLAVAGHVQIHRADIQVPDNMPASVAVLDVRRAGQKPPPPPAPGPDVALDLTLDAPRAIFVRGRGLDAELAGRLHVGGTTAKPIPHGGFTISLSSTPELPQDEVISYLLFRQSTANLSPFQLASIAAALAQVTGVTGGSDPLNRVRKGLGLDTLSVNGGTGTGSSASPTVEAGRYVAPGVYVGAKQSTSGNQTGATVQIDIARGLKLQTDVGSGSGSNNVGLTYQFQY
jgi:translocation and assembly module TamB